MQENDTEHYRRKFKADWTMFAFQLAIPMMIGLVVYAIDTRRQLETQEMLQNYVTKAEFKERFAGVEQTMVEFKNMRAALQQQLNMVGESINGLDKRLEVLITKLEVQQRYNRNQNNQHGSYETEQTARTAGQGNRPGVGHHHYGGDVIDRDDHQRILSYIVH